MTKTILDADGDVVVYGRGRMGGKGAGLARIAEGPALRARKLPTRILTTSIYDRYLELGGRFAAEDVRTLAGILAELGGTPISIRSSATDEAGVAEGGTAVLRAGENASFMLPNNHPEPGRRFGQFLLAVHFIYQDFLRKQPPGGAEKMAVVINPIPGVHEDTDAGPIYFPLVSGVANSHFPYALKTQDPRDGFARIAFGHGYATVLDQFPVISVATIRDPVPLKMMGPGQRQFYALDMTKNETLSGQELETMRLLHVRFAPRARREPLGLDKDTITFAGPVEENRFGFRTGLIEVMEALRARISGEFQIEFVFNLVPGSDGPEGVFHIVQLTQFPEFSHEPLLFPDPPGRVFIATRSFQGHGVRRDIRAAVVVSPFRYRAKRRIEVKARIAEINASFQAKGERFIIVVPGRLGSGNAEWGIPADFRDIDQAAAIFEYGVDVAGRAEPLREPEELSKGGVYGSHFLYMIQGGYDEDQKRLRTRMYGTQGTHFLTNLAGHNIIYGFLSPLEDTVDPWLFRADEGGGPASVLTFPRPVTITADSTVPRCVVAESA